MKTDTYRYGWIVWLVCALFLELTGLIFNGYYALGLVATFVLLEGMAVKRPAAGDTLSETIWAFVKGGWARGLLVSGMVVWIGVRFYQIGNSPLLEPHIGFDPGRMALTVGLVGWLLVHFNLQGRKG